MPAYPSAIGLKATVLVETGRVEEAWSERTRVVLRVHTSNYRIVGFTSAIPAADLVAAPGRAVARTVPPSARPRPVRSPPDPMTR